MRSFYLRLLAGLFGGMALAACAATPAGGSYRGVLHLKGNAPFVQPVLEDEHGQLWQLEGVDRETASELQNRQVEVEGQVAGKGVPPKPAVLQVKRIRPLPPRQ